jgi:antitoxin CcdA
LTPPSAFDPATPKKPTNVSLNQDLVRAAKAYGLNVSRIAEAALAEAVRARARQDWLANNAEALDAYNEKVGRRGVFSDGHRRF